MAYIGNSPANVGNYQIVDDISSSFNGVLTTFALTVSSSSISPVKSGQLLVGLNGVMQQPDDTGTNGFKVSGSNIIFSSAPTSSSTFWSVYQGQNVDVGTPSNSTVGTSELSATGTASSSTYLRGDNTWAVIVDDDTIYTHPTTAGNKHVPTGGSSGQFLKYDSSGTAVWAADNDTVYTHPTGAGNEHLPSAVSQTEAGYLNGVTSDIQTQLDAKVAKTASTGSAALPTGTTAQRDGTPTAGYMRYNSTTASFEGYGSAWGSIGGGATGAGGDAVFMENELIVTTDYTLSTNKSALSVGPVTINSGVSVTITSGYTWVVL